MCRDVPRNDASAVRTSEPVEAFVFLQHFVDFADVVPSSAFRGGHVRPIQRTRASLCEGSRERRFRDVGEGTQKLEFTTFQVFTRKSTVDCRIRFWKRGRGQRERENRKDTTEDRKDRTYERY